MISDWERPDMQLEKDRWESTKRDNYYRGLNMPIPQPEPSQDSRLDTLDLRAKIELAIEQERDSLHICDYIHQLPTSEKLDAMCDCIGPSLGLNLQWEDSGKPNDGTRDLLFYWE